MPYFAIRYRERPNDPKDKGVPLTDITVKKGHWVHSVKLSEVHTAKEWGFRPSELGICTPEWDLPYMMAHDQVFEKMAKFESELREEKIKEQSRKKGR